MATPSIPKVLISYIDKCPKPPVKTKIKKKSESLKELPNIYKSPKPPDFDVPIVKSVKSLPKIIKSMNDFSSLKSLAIPTIPKIPKFSQALTDSSTEKKPEKIIRTRYQPHKKKSLPKINLEDIRSGNITMICTDIKEKLINIIRQSEKIIGCIAWITDSDIIRELLSKETHLVINKERWIKKCLHLKDYYDNFTSIKYVGNPHGKKGNPMMHNKFLVFYDNGVPIKTWTGSFNFTKNSDKSYENAILIEDQTIAEGYRNLWQQIYDVSEFFKF